MTTFLIVLAIIVGAGVWMALLFGGFTLLTDDRPVAGWSMVAVSVLVLAAGITLAIRAEEDEAPCVRSHYIYVNGVPYEVCDERATPVGPPR